MSLTSLLVNPLGQADLICAGYTFMYYNTLFQKNQVLLNLFRKNYAEIILFFRVYFVYVSALYRHNTTKYGVSQYVFPLSVFFRYVPTETNRGNILLLPLHFGYRFSTLIIIASNPAALFFLNLLEDDLNGMVFLDAAEGVGQKYTFVLTVYDDRCHTVSLVRRNHVLCG